MNNILNDFGAFIDSLRKSRNMSREEFTEGIISIRQYQRYVNGESSLNNEKLFKLIDKLGMNYLNIHKLYINRNKHERPKLNLIYKEIISQNYKLATELIEKISVTDFHDEYNKSFYVLCELILYRRTKKMPSSLIVDKLKKLINYPNCMKNEVISFVEYVAYLDISSYSSSSEDDVKIVNFLYKKINDNSISTDSLFVLYLPSTYAHVSKKLGSHDEYDKALKIAQKGIDFCIESDSLNSLVHLFFYKALSLMYLDRIDDALIAAKKVFALLYVEDKEHKTKNFTTLFENSFNMKVSEL